MIKVCDAIMGNGKTQSAITYMKEHQNERFIYVTPFNTETERVQAALPEMQFKLPDKTHEKFEFSKRLHFKHMLEYGDNIAITHKLFGMCDEETVDLIHSGDYIVIVDEAIDIMEATETKKDDVELAMNSEYFRVSEDCGMFKLIESEDKPYRGKWMEELKIYARGHRLALAEGDDNKSTFYCWRFDKKILEAPKQVIILTYLFKSSTMYYMMQSEGMPYQLIGVIRDEDGTYRFSETEMQPPEYTKHLGDMIHIEDDDYMNYIGNRYNALSINWQREAKRHKSNKRCDTLKSRLYTYFHNRHPEAKSSDRLWTCHEKSLRYEIKGAGFSDRWIPFNKKSTNDYRQATVLAYIMNVYMPVWIPKFFEQKGIKVDQEAHALSVLIQWIWRSAIRDGKEVYIYIPSRRMRELLEDWIDDVMAGTVDVEPVGTIVEPKMPAVENTTILEQKQYEAENLEKGA